MEILENRKRRTKLTYNFFSGPNLHSGVCLVPHSLHVMFCFFFLTFGAFSNQNNESNILKTVPNKKDLPLGFSVPSHSCKIDPKVNRLDKIVPENVNLKI